jgi:UDP-4-amino-4,6-dideoxy-N-acetyl-beta-L-altrosamine transaminase
LIPYSRQSINSKDILEVKKVLKSNFLTQGKNVEIFEKLITQISNAKYGVAVNSASSALHLACIALGIKKGDRVWTVPNTFVASANCAINCGAIVDFVDIDKNTWNISIEELEKKLAVSKKKKKLPKLLIPVHFAGQPTEQKKIWELSKKYKFKILEDASHSIGATHLKEKTGSCRWSDITVFSFHPVKIITTGEGGMALTNNKKFADEMRILRTNGISQKNFIYKKNKNKPWYYEHQKVGFNYRMNDISATLGISQVKRIKEFINKRNLIAKKYQKYLKDYPIKFQLIKKYNTSSFHLLPIRFDLKKTKMNYKNIFKKFRSSKLFVNLHYMPLHLSPYFKKKGFKKGDYKNAEEYANSSISIPIFYDLKEKEVSKISSFIKKFFK